VTHVKILHTSDWHVGKVLKGQSRHDEQVAVLREIVELARAEQPDLVIVAGDLFDTAAPGARATRLVTRALSGLRRTGAEVVAIAGNHDNGAALDALRHWAEAAGITLRGTIRGIDDHLITGTTRAGEPWRLVALPFLSQRYAVRAVEMFDLTGAEANQEYTTLVTRLLERLTHSFDARAINLITAHLTVLGGALGGGERAAQTILSYAVPATAFPASAHYVALGHLHRQQKITGPAPTYYSGSPLALDFGEEENTPGVLLVEVTPDTPARVRSVPITSALPLRTVRGTLAELTEYARTLRTDQRSASTDGAADTGAAARSTGSVGVPDDHQRSSEPWLRVFVRERPRAGLREEVQELLPRALEVRIDPELLEKTQQREPRTRRAGRSASELFADYLRARGHDDPEVRELFDQLYADLEVTES